MRSIYQFVFEGHLSRVRYFVALIILLFIGGIAAQIGKEVGAGASVMTWVAIYLLTSILDAK